MLIVAANFAFDALGVLVAANPFAAVVEFDDEIETPLSADTELKRGVGKELSGIGLEGDGILTGQMLEHDVTSLAAIGQRHDEIDQRPRVKVAILGDPLEVASLGKNGVETVQHAVPDARQLVVIGRAALAGHRVRKAGEKSALGENLQPSLHDSSVTERLVKRAAEGQQLIGRERQGIERRQHLKVAFGNVESGRRICHGSPTSVASNDRQRSYFSLHGTTKTSLPIGR